MANTFFTQIGQQVGKIARGIFGGGRVPTGIKTNIWGVGAQEIYAPIEQDTAITKGFDANTAVYSITKKYAKKAASIERYLENKKDETEIENHPLMVLLQRPNPKQSHYAFFKSVYAFYKVCGEAFIWLNRGDVTQMVTLEGELVDRTRDQYLAQPIIEMHVIPSNEIVLVPDPEDPFQVAYYHLRNRPSIRFNGADIIHWMDLNLDWDEFSRPQMRGMTPLKPGFKTLTADNSFIDSMVRMAQNDGAKGAIVNKTLGKMTPKQETQVRDVIDTKVNNKEIKNAIAALEGDWTYLDFGLTSVDMQTLEARDFIYKEMCFLLDVPYGFFDSHTPYAEKQLAARDWVTNSIKPDCQELDGELQRSLFPAFGLTDQTAKLCSNFDDLPEMQEDKKTQVEWLMQAPLSPNEVREELGFEKRPEPEMDEVYMKSGQVPITDPIVNDPNQILDDVNAMENAGKSNAGANSANGNGKVSYRPA